MGSRAALSLALWVSVVFSCSDGPRPVVVGSKNFTEQVILGELVAQLLEAHDVPVDRRLNLGGSFICHQALVAGSLDIYVEYTGTALTAILREPFDYDAQKVYQRVRDVYRDDLNLEWSAPLGFNNTFAIIMTRARASELGATKISDLAEHQSTIRPGAGHEFLEREDGLRGLTEAYQLEFSIAPRGMELGLIYQALVEGQVDFVAGNSTDGLIEKFNLVVLEDDRRFFPPYDAAAVYRPDAVERYPALADVLEILGGGLDEPSMRRLNRLVDEERRAVRDVVSDFLKEQGWSSVHAREDLD
jgi:glycine betaine/choline ABC-type transport system substrate-binding protein